MDWVNIGSGDGLSPVRSHVINWTNADLLSIGLLETNFGEFESIIIFTHENAFENVVCQIVGHFVDSREMTKQSAHLVHNRYDSFCIICNHNLNPYRDGGFLHSKDE